MKWEMENKFQLFFEKSSDAYLILSNYKIIECNASVLALLGYFRKEEIIGKSVREISPEYQIDGKSSAEMASFHINQAIVLGNNRFEWLHKKFDGSSIPVEVVLTPIQDNDEYMIYAALRDISDHKEKELEMEQANELQRKLIATIPDIVVICDTAGTITFINDSLEKISKYKKSEVVGRSIFEFFHPEDRSLSIENTQKMMNGYLGTVDYRFIDKDNTIIPLEANGEVLRNNDGIPYGMVFTCRDISERKRSEQELKESEQRFKALQDAAFSSIVIHKNGIILDVSQSFCDLSGYLYEELIGNEGSFLFSSEFRKPIEDVFLNYSAVPYKSRLLRKTGIEIDVEILGRQIPYKGQIVRVAEIRNISERILTEAKLKEYTAKLEEANNTKDRLFSIIAHDLRSPFQGLLGYAELLSSAYDNFDELEYKAIIESVNNSLKNLYGLIENLLYWSRMQTEGFVFNPTDLNVYEIIDDVIQRLTLNINSKELEVYNLVEENLLVFADQNMISTIFQNLISNAIKFSFRNGKIIINSIVGEKYLEFSVSDNGIGISSENQKKLFLMGENLTSVGTENEKGTGLGLVLSKEMIELHGGKIEVESEENKGSKITIFIPKIFRGGNR